MIDTHCHLSHPDFDADREAVIARCWQGGVTAILEVGYSVETSRSAVDIARRHPRIRASVGIHPHEAGRAGDEDFTAIQELSREPEVIAIGETGLDFYRDWAPRDRQVGLFTKTVRFSLERDLPLLIHDRDAHEDVLRILREEGRGKARGIFHCFSGDLDVANAAIGLGFYLGLGGSVTYMNPRKKKGLMLRELPLDRILLETDAPWLSPEPEKGERNDPTRMRHVVARLAEAQGTTEDEIARRTTENVVRLFPTPRPGRRRASPRANRVRDDRERRPRREETRRPETRRPRRGDEAQGDHNAPASHPRPKKRFSQNFLVDGNMARKIVDLCQIRPDDTVIEIGAGTGALTRHLLLGAGHLHAVELDRELFEHLRVEFEDEPKLTLHQDDILKLRVRNLVPGGRALVVGNLPYAITHDLVLWLLDQHADIRRAVVLMQREVAMRLCAEPGERVGGTMTLAVHYRAQAERILDVPPSCFRPVPKVTSSLVAFRFLDEPPVRPRDEAFFFRVIRAAFGERRKTLANALAAGLGEPRASVEAAVRDAGLDPMIRGERLSLEEFARLADRLGEARPEGDPRPEGETQS